MNQQPQLTNGKRRQKGCRTQGRLSVSNNTTSKHHFSQSAFETSTQESEYYSTTGKPSIPWAPAVAIGGLASLLSDSKHRKLNCSQSLRDVVEKLAPNPQCQCDVGEMLSNRSRCERAPLMTFGVKLRRLCGESIGKEDEKLAASLVVLKVSVLISSNQLNSKNAFPILRNNYAIQM